MDKAISLHFESKLRAPREKVWEWISSVEGISTEMRPYFRMTTPDGIHSLADLNFRPGKRLFRSRLFLFGFLPIGYSDLTLLELNSGQGFVEQSPMSSMKLWRHERSILPCPDDQQAVLLTDKLTFQPRMARRFVGWFIKRVFLHRHAVLKARLDGSGEASSGSTVTDKLDQA